MRIVDLSNPLENTDFADPPGLGPKIDYIDHKMTVPQMLSFFPGVTPDQLPGGEAWAAEMVTMTTHNGTHLDAPWHYHSTMDGGKRAITIDEVPLEWCMGRGVKLDFRHFGDGHVVSEAEMAAAFADIGHELAEGDIVLINTAAGAKYGTPDYVATGCGMGRAATNWLTARGVRVCGTDAWSWDAPFVHTAKRVAETGDTSLIWEGHRAGMDKGYCHIEKMANLDSLPPTGFEVSCFPVKVKAASAGWCRPVAIFRD